MSKPILIANWKNHPSSLIEANRVLKDLSRQAILYKKLSVFIAPPAPYLETVSIRARKFSKLGAQDFFPNLKGTFTGEVTVDILKDFGVRLVILGHSERRGLGETSQQVSEKAKSALRSGMVPLVCVGELVRDVDGEHFEFLREQIKSSLSGLSKQAVSSVLIAYEPVWAIGKGAKDALSPRELSQSVIFIRKVLSDLFGRKAAESVAILYGGSVDPTNAGALVAEGGVKGLLVGRASLNPKSFAEIAHSLIK